MKVFYNRAAFAYFVAATIILMLIAALLLGTAVWQLAAKLGSSGMANTALDSVGLLIIGFAIVETARFIAEEEILRDSELRSSVESRRSLTKFTTIIVIAVSLEALVMIFKSNETGLERAIYPALLFVAAMLALVALGLYQWLSSRILPPSEEEKKEAQSEEDE